MIEQYLAHIQVEAPVGYEKTAPLSAAMRFGKGGRARHGKWLLKVLGLSPGATPDEDGAIPAILTRDVWDLTDFTQTPSRVACGEDEVRRIASVIVSGARFSEEDHLALLWEKVEAEAEATHWSKDEETGKRVLLRPAAGQPNLIMTALVDAGFAETPSGYELASSDTTTLAALKGDIYLALAPPRYGETMYSRSRGMLWSGIASMTPGEPEHTLVERSLHPLDPYKEVWRM